MFFIFLFSPLFYYFSVTKIYMFFKITEKSGFFIPELVSMKLKDAVLF